MEIVFIAITQEPYGRVYPGTMDAVRAASARAGCPVWLLTDHRPFLHSTSNPVVSLPLLMYWKTAGSYLAEETTNIEDRLSVASVLRWMILWDFIETKPDIQWPILALDTDVLVFSDLNAPYQPFLTFDFCAELKGNNTSAAYSVHNAECLNESVRVAQELGKTRRRVNDMQVWTAIYQSNLCEMGNLEPERDGSVFDMSMHGQCDRYETEPSTDTIWGPVTKKITWLNGCPHFTRKDDGKLVKSHWIHCWGSYKNRTGELVKAAGL